METENFHVVGEWKGPGVILGEEPLLLGDEARVDSLRGGGGNDDVLGGDETIEAKASIGAGETALSFSSFVLVGAMLSRTSSSLPSAASVDSASSRGAFSNKGEGIVAPGLMLLLLEAIFAWGLLRPPARVPDAEGIVASLSDPSAPAASRSSPTATDRLTAESLSSVSPPSSAETNGSSLDDIVADAA